MTKNYQVKLSLVQNPKCPVALSLKYLPLLNADDLKHVAKSKNVPGALSTGARRCCLQSAPQASERLDQYAGLNGARDRFTVGQARDTP